MPYLTYLPTLSSTSGVAVFMSGNSSYKKNQPEGSVINQVAGIFYEACISRRHIQIDEISDLTEKLAPTSHANSNRSKSTEAEDKVEKEVSQSARWLDRASKNYGGSYSDALILSVKYIWRLSPFLLVMIPYWGIYGQTKTAFQIQGCQMNVNLGSLKLPVSAMNIFNNIAILILVPLFEQRLYPYLKKHNRELSMLQKLGLGLICAVAAMIAAAIVEVIRRQYVPASGNYYDQDARDNISACRDIDDYNPYQYVEWYSGTCDDCDEPANCNQVCDLQVNGTLSVECVECDDIPQMSDMSMLWQMPLFVLVGISEIFASITSLEFFYSQAPSEMRSVSQACNLFTNAIGSWLTIPLTILVNVNSSDEWIPSDLNSGHLELYFLVLAALMLVAYVGFVQISKGYVYISAEHFENRSNSYNDNGSKSQNNDDDNDKDVMSPMR